MLISPFILMALEVPQYSQFNLNCSFSNYDPFLSNNINNNKNNNPRTCVAVDAFFTRVCSYAVVVVVAVVAFVRRGVFSTRRSGNPLEKFVFRSPIKGRRKHSANIHQSTREPIQHRHEGKNVFPQ